jgi:hypothetical protein
MYEKLFKPLVRDLPIVLELLAAVVMTYLHELTVAAVVISCAVLSVSARFYLRLQGLKAEIAALRADFAAAPLPVRNDAPGRG